MTVCSQLQALFLRPGLDTPQPSLEADPPLHGAQPHLGLGDDCVEQGHVDEVKELGEELDGKSSIDTTSPQQVHGRGECVEDIAEDRSPFVTSRQCVLCGRKK